MQNKSFIESNKDKIKNFRSIDEYFNRKGYGTVYDLNSFEVFYEKNQYKGNILSINDGILSTSYNIKLNGKPITRDKLLEFVKSLGLGPEYIASIEMRNGIATVGEDVSTNGDLVKVKTGGRWAHIHNHPPIAFKLEFDYTYFDINGKQQTANMYYNMPVLNPGADAADQSQAHITGLRSVVVDPAKIYLINGEFGETIRFDRKKDNMNKYGNLFLFVLLVSCNSATDSAYSVVKNNTEYEIREKMVLNVLEKSHCLHVNDSAKWYLYNIYCDDEVPSSITKSTKSVFFSNLDLKAIAIGYSYDSSSFEIIYNFIYQDTIPVRDVLTKYHYIVDGISVDLKTKQINGFVRGHGGRFLVNGENSRFLNPIQPEVIKFVKANKQSLNGWYLKALSEHGIKL